MMTNNRKRESGLSLVELMISLAISSLVTVGLIQMFTASQESADLLRGQAAVGESGRFAMEMMARSIRQSGNRGCNSKREIENTIGTVPYEFSLTNGVQGLEGDPASMNWTPSFGLLNFPLTSGASDTNVYSPNGESGTGVPEDDLVQGSDILTVWFADPTTYSVDPAAAIASGTEDIRLCHRNAATATACNVTKAMVEEDIERYHIALINDCATENMIVITNIATDSGLASLQHSAGAGVSGAVNLTPIMGTGSGYQNTAVVQPIVSHTYFVAQSSNVNKFGDPVFSLFRKSGVNAPIELVEGIEDMQILYGVDDQGALLVPSTWVTASSVDNFADVIAIRVQLTASSVNDVGSTQGWQDNNADGVVNSDDADGLLRRNFTQTIRLRNRLRKET